MNPEGSMPATGPYHAFFYTFSYKLEKLLLQPQIRVRIRSIIAWDTRVT